MRCFGMLWIRLFANIFAANDEVRSWLPRLVIFLLGVFMEDFIHFPVGPCSKGRASGRVGPSYS